MSEEKMRLPKTYDKVQEELDDLICTIEYKENMNNPLAYTCRNIGERSGCSYKIVCSKDNEKLTPFLLAHEAGHILLNHCKDLSTSDLLVKGKIKACWDKISHYFEGKDLDETFNYFESYLYNVTMDWEVNSKILDLDDIEYMEETINENSDNQVQFLYPTRNNYPEKKTWMEYITYIVLDPESFFQNMSNPQQQNNQQKSNKDGKEDGEGNNQQGQQEQQNNKGNSQQEQQNNKGNSQQQGQQSSPSFKDLPEDAKKEIIDDFFKKMKENVDEENKKEEASEKDENFVRGNGNGDSSDDSLDYLDYNNIPTDFPGMSKKGNKASKLEETVEDYSDDSLEEQLLKCLKTETHKSTKRDPVYYYNRRKYGSDVLYIKNKREKYTKYNKSMCVLLDVSGSISHDNLQKFIEVFKNVSKKLHKRCYLVLWNTGLVNEYDTYKDKDIQAYSGGGTDMASGLNYIQNNKRYRDSSIIVVSDFEDTIEDWKYNKKIYGICWEKEVFDYIKNREDYKDFLKMFNKIFVEN